MTMNTEQMIAEMKRTITHIKEYSPIRVIGACDYLENMIDKLVATLKEEARGSDNEQDRGNKGSARGN